MWRRDLVTMVTCLASYRGLHTTASPTSLRQDSPLEDKFGCNNVEFEVQHGRPAAMRIWVILKAEIIVLIFTGIEHKSACRQSIIRSERVIKTPNSAPTLLCQWLTANKSGPVHYPALPSCHTLCIKTLLLILDHMLRRVSVFLLYQSHSKYTPWRPLSY